MKTRIVIIIMAIMPFVVSVVNGQDAAAILKKMDDIMYSPRDMVARNRITLIDRNGREEVREALVMQKGNDKRLMRFTAPASQAGISVLSLPNDVMYLYLPAFGRERRIASSAKNQNFAGTDFSYEDMESVPFSQKYTPKLLREGPQVYVLELTPKGRSEYSKLIVHINKTHFYPELMEFYNRGNNKIKEARYVFKKVGNYFNASEIEMADLRRNHRTRMEMFDVKYDTGLTDDEFTVRKLVQ